MDKIKPDPSLSPRECADDRTEWMIKSILRRFMEAIDYVGTLAVMLDIGYYSNKIMIVLVYHIIVIASLV
jgi:hypothetical protein